MLLVGKDNGLAGVFRPGRQSFSQLAPTGLQSPFLNLTHVGPAVNSGQAVGGGTFGRSAYKANARC